MVHATVGIPVGARGRESGLPGSHGPSRWDQARRAMLVERLSRAESEESGIHGSSGTNLGPGHPRFGGDALTPTSMAERLDIWAGHTRLSSTPPRASELCPGCSAKMGHGWRWWALVGNARVAHKGGWWGSGGHARFEVRQAHPSIGGSSGWMPARGSRGLDRLDRAWRLESPSRAAMSSARPDAVRSTSFGARRAAILMGYATIRRTGVVLAGNLPRTRHMGS
jgi:hypothetical protein